MSARDPARKRLGETSRSVLNTNRTKTSLATLIKQKFATMLHRAALQSNAARGKIREQLAILRLRSVLPRGAEVRKQQTCRSQALPTSGDREAVAENRKTTRRKPRYDSSLVDLIDSIETERPLEGGKQFATFSCAGNKGADLRSSSKVYYPRAQLYARPFVQP